MRWILKSTTLLLTFFLIFLLLQKIIIISIMIFIIVSAYSSSIAVPITTVTHSNLKEVAVGRKDSQPTAIT
jgi:hypothetical protein